MRKKEKQWKKDVGLWAKKEKSFETKQEELEKELKEKNKEKQVKVISPFVQSGTDSLSQAMSQVSLKYLEIIGLKNQNKNLEDIDEKKEKRKEIHWKTNVRNW